MGAEPRTGGVAGPRGGAKTRQGRSQQLRRRGSCTAQDVPLASGHASSGGTCMSIGQYWKKAVSIGPRSCRLCGRCPDAGASRSEASGADGPGRAGTRARANGGACAAARPGRGSGRRETTVRARGRRLLGPWALGPEDTGLPVAMTTGDCCHLPGSLCDCSGSPAFSKVVEATGLGPPQYVAQVTSRDGRLLSTVIRALDTPGDCPFCRICHEGANGESLLSPCGCAGTLGAVHKSCLEKWLSSSNTSYCELCHTEFAVEKRPRPLTEWLRNPGPRTEKRTLCCDVVCFLFITPLAAVSGWLCLRGAQDHLRLHSRLEAVGLIALTIALFTIYVLWTLVSFRYHCQLYSEWRRTNQKVRLKIRDADGPEDAHHSPLAAELLKKVAEETPV